MNAPLTSLQQDFQRFILGQLTTADMSPHIATRPGLTNAERLEIYHTAYRLRLRDALSEAFDKTHRYLGDALFYECCLAYIEQTPSEHRNLRWYGAQFPAFLGTRLGEHPTVAELAAFEWALSLAFDAPDQSVLTLEQCRNFSAEEWASITFACQASLQFLALHTNCVALWRALDEEQTPPAPEYVADAAPWLIWRKDLQAHFRSISADEEQALRGLQAGLPFAEVCANAAQNNPDITPQIAVSLNTWISEQVLVGK